MTPYHIFQTVTVHIMESVYQSGLFRFIARMYYIFFKIESYVHNLVHPCERTILSHCTVILTFL